VVSVREFLEGYEQRLVDEYGELVPSMVMVIRYEITGFSDTEVQQSIDDIAQLLSSPYQIFRHRCFHDEDPHKPCELTLVREG
jgi:purine nucleoside phosphorylase